MSAKEDKSINDLSFEQAIKILTDTVGKIETGEIGLQDSLEEYEKGMKLIKHCRKVLAEAEKRIEKIAETEPKARNSKS